MAPTDITLPLAEASLDQLRWFATNVCGLDIPKTTNANTIRSKISQVHEKTEITVPAAIGTVIVSDSAAPGPFAVATSEHALRAGSHQAGDKAKIFVEVQEGPGGNRPVFVSVNGVGILIPRAKEVEVAVPYVEALEHAVGTVYDFDNDGNQTSREVLHYPFRILRDPRLQPQAA
jgi:hypothetical protein